MILPCRTLEKISSKERQSAWCTRPRRTRMRRNQLVEDFIEGETVCLGFFVGVIGDANTIVTDSINNGLDVHKITLPNGLCLPL